MPRVLLVTNVFPPSAGSPSEKAGSRVKYLHQYGWESIVLAPNLNTTELIDENIVTNMPPVEVHRTPYLFQKQMPSLNKSRGVYLSAQDRDGFGWLYLPNGYIRWLPYAVCAGMRLAKKADIILSFNNPTMIHLVGFFISRLSGKPWVAGLRDPISGNPIHRRGPERFNVWVENLVASQADRVVQWGDYVVEAMSTRHPDQPSDRFVIIPYTGFSPDDFCGVDLTPPVNNLPLRIAYTGSFYPGSITPEPILNALGSLIKDGRLSVNDIHITFAGDWNASYNRLVEELNLSDQISYLGLISRKDCVKLWVESHVLLMILGENFDSPDRFPAKFWDYVGAHRYILALVPPNGKLARLVQEQQLGIVSPPSDISSIADTLVNIFEAFRKAPLTIAPTSQFLAAANRMHGERMLAKTLSQVYEQYHSKRVELK